MSCSSCSGASSAASQYNVSMLLMQQKNAKSQGEAILSLLEAAKVDVPNPNGNISIQA